MTMVNQALALVALGYSVFPCAGKIPAIKGGAGCLDATRHEESLRRMWQRYPQANPGVHTLDLAVVDVEPRRGGDRTLEGLLGRHGSLPRTPQVRTGGGGLHAYFRMPSGRVRRGGNVLGQGIDLKIGRGCYVLGAGSIHPDTGRRYEWLADPTVPLADMPGWMVKIAAPPPAPAYEAPPRRLVPHAGLDVAERARRYLALLPAAVEGQGGSRQTFWAAVCLVRGFMLDEDTALGLLREYNARCKPRWSERELLHKVQSAADDARRPLGFLLNGRTRAA